MSDYPTQYRGNTIYDEGTVRDLDPESKPNLTLVQSDHEIDQILDHIGVTQDRSSIVAEDSYGCLWVDTADGDYSEVWGMHNNTPFLSKGVVRLQ